MKKFLFLGFLIFLGISNVANATSGACSSHGGVNCSAGSDWDGSVICNDGWTGSSISYSSMAMCSQEHECPLMPNETFTEADWNEYKVKYDRLSAEIYEESEDFYNESVARIKAGNYPTQIEKDMFQQVIDSKFMMVDIYLDYLSCRITRNEVIKPTPKIENRIEETNLSESKPLIPDNVEVVPYKDYSKELKKKSWFGRFIENIAFWK